MIFGIFTGPQVIHRRPSDPKLSKPDHDHRNNDDRRIFPVPNSSKYTRQDNANQQAANGDCDVAAKNADDVLEITSFLRHRLIDKEIQ